MQHRCHITPHHGCDSHIKWDWQCRLHIAGPNPLKGFHSCDCPIEKAFPRISAKFQFKSCKNYFYIFCFKKIAFWDWNHGQLHFFLDLPFQWGISKLPAKFLLNSFWSNNNIIIVHRQKLRFDSNSSLYFLECQILLFSRDNFWPKGIQKKFVGKCAYPLSNTVGLNPAMIHDWWKSASLSGSKSSAGIVALCKTQQNPASWEEKVAHWS